MTLINNSKTQWESFSGNNYYIKFIAIFILLLLNLNIYSQWQPVNGPNGGSVSTIEGDGSNIYIITYDGVYRSVNGGQNWNKASNGLPWGGFFPIVIDGSNLYVAGDGGIFRSIDNGNSWTSFALNTYTILSFAIIGTKMYAGTIGQGLFVSTDQGTTWSIVNPSWNNAYVYLVFNTGSSLIVSTNIGTFRSADGGSTWTEVISGFSGTSINSLIVYGSDLFASTDWGLHKSDDDGISWNYINIPGLTSSSFGSITIKGSQLFITNPGSGILTSTDGGNTWVQSTNGLNGFLEVNTVKVIGNNIYAGTYRGGLYRSLDNGSSWQEINNGIFQTVITKLITDGTDLFASTRYNGVFKYSPGNNTWQPKQVGIAEKSIYTLHRSDNHIYAGTENGIYISTNSGDNWSQSGLQNTQIFSMVSHDNDVYASGFVQFYKAPIGSNAWSTLSSSGINTAFLTLARVNNINIFAGTFNGIYSYNFIGNSWISIGLENMAVFHFYEYGLNIFAGTHNGLYKSVDGGSNWSLVSTLPLGEVRNIIAQGAAVFATVSGNVFMSTDNGYNWSNISNGLSNERIDVLEIIGNILYAGTNGAGVWARNMSELQIKNAEDISSIEVIPNPLIQSSTITFSLYQSNSEVQIIDMAGRIVRSLNFSGKEIQINRENLTTGIYLIQIRSGSGQVMNKKLMVL